MGLDFILAHICGRTSGRDFPARKVSEGAAIVLDSAFRVAFLGVLLRTDLVSDSYYHRILCAAYGQETLIEQDLPQNIERSQSGRPDQVVSE